MNYLYLPGFSPKNKQELESFVSYFSTEDIDLITHTWRHWDDESVEWSPAIEAAAVLEKISKDDEFTLIAKSIGTFVGTLIADKVTCSRVVLMGVPLTSLDKGERWLYKNYDDADLTIFQRTNDPHGSMGDVKAMFADSNAELVELEGDTHRYDVPTEVSNLLLGE